MFESFVHFGSFLDYLKKKPSIIAASTSLRFRSKPQHKVILESDRNISFQLVSRPIYSILHRAYHLILDSLPSFHQLLHQTITQPITIHHHHHSSRESSSSSSSSSTKTPSSPSSSSSNSSSLSSSTTFSPGMPFHVTYSCWTQWRLIGSSYGSYGK